MCYGSMKQVYKCVSLFTCLIKNTGQDAEQHNLVRKCNKWSFYTPVPNFDMLYKP